MGTYTETYTGPQKCHAVVAGPFLLDLLDSGTNSRNHAVEIYAPCDRWAAVLDELAAWECRRVASHITTLPTGTTSCAVYCIGTGTVRVFRSANQSAVYPIAFFRHTLLMNYMSFDHICVAYPRLTFARQGVVNTRPLLAQEQALTEMDKTHGYTIVNDVDRGGLSGNTLCVSCPTCPGLLRTMRDVRCSFLRLTTQPIRLVRHNVEWRMESTGCVFCYKRVQKLKVDVRDSGNTWI